MPAGHAHNREDIVSNLFARVAELELQNAARHSRSRNLMLVVQVTGIFLGLANLCFLAMYLWVLKSSPMTSALIQSLIFSSLMTSFVLALIVQLLRNQAGHPPAGSGAVR